MARIGDTQLPLISAAWAIQGLAGNSHCSSIITAFLACLGYAIQLALLVRYASLGGCLPECWLHPSKALLHVAAAVVEVSHLGALGIEFYLPKVNIDMLRSHKDKVIGKLTGGLAAGVKMSKVTTMRGVGQFVDAHHLQVKEPRMASWDTSATEFATHKYQKIFQRGINALATRSPSRTWTRRV